MCLLIEQRDRPIVAATSDRPTAHKPVNGAAQFVITIKQTVAVMFCLLAGELGWSGQSDSTGSTAEQG